MSSLRFTLRAEPDQRLDLSAFTPDRLAGLTEPEIARLPLATTRQNVSVGDIFTVQMADPTDIVIEGSSARFDNVADAMTAGAIRVTGDVGLRAGHRMRGGKLAIEGDAGPFAASGLRGGQIAISGNAGPFLAAPGVGEQGGMRGGSVVVRGNAGSAAATRLRRGTVVIEGDADADAACSMIAGTLIICGHLSAPPARLMRRGTILLRHPVKPPAGFAPSGRASPVFQALLASFLRPLSPLAATLAQQTADRLAGDLSAEGKGEILMTASGT
ncbi:MAG: formylmethanofuran dehydrogenase subunit C [Acetobacteraceae bacterium]|nr:formylmethanofuran dehydrogenase subunit C [Acetobacteraceae bacterium]